MSRYISFMSQYLFGTVLILVTVMIGENVFTLQGSCYIISLSSSSPHSHPPPSTLSHNSHHHHALTLREGEREGEDRWDTVGLPRASITTWYVCSVCVCVRDYVCVCVCVCVCVIIPYSLHCRQSWNWVQT